MNSERLPFERWLEFRYTRPLPIMDRIFLGVWVALSIAASAVALIQGREMWPAPFVFSIVVAIFISGRRSAFLEIGRKSMRCEITPGRRTSIAWEAVTELRESHFDLGIVHRVNSDYSRLSLPKRFFKEEHWRQIIGAISEQVLREAPEAIIEIHSVEVFLHAPGDGSERE